jgi:hypothetical protein
MIFQGFSLLWRKKKVIEAFDIYFNEDLLAFCGITRDPLMMGTSSGITIAAMYLSIPAYKWAKSADDVGLRFYDVDISRDGKRISVVTDKYALFSNRMILIFNHLGDLLH